MSTRRKFTFPLANAANLLGDALADPDYADAMSMRLGEEFVSGFPNLVTAVTGGQAVQNSKTGDLSRLTAEQRADLREMERLASGARASAKLAFPGQDTVLRAEFQVGTGDSQSLAATVSRCRLIHTAAVKHAARLQAKGWLPADSVLLDTAILGLEEVAGDQDEAGDDRLDLTDGKIKAANALYAACQAIQNAANLQYPGGTDSEGNARNLTARARFLMDEFPPRDRPDEVVPPAP